MVLGRKKFDISARIPCQIHSSDFDELSRPNKKRDIFLQCSWNATTNATANTTANATVNATAIDHEILFCPVLPPHQIISYISDKIRRSQRKNQKQSLNHISSIRVEERVCDPLLCTAFENLKIATASHRLELHVTL